VLLLLQSSTFFNTSTQGSAEPPPWAESFYVYGVADAYLPPLISQRFPAFPDFARRSKTPETSTVANAMADTSSGKPAFSAFERDNHNNRDNIDAIREPRCGDCN
jgi:hypothetical protein